MIIKGFVYFLHNIFQKLQNIKQFYYRLIKKNVNYSLWKLTPAWENMANIFERNKVMPSCTDLYVFVALTFPSLVTWKRHDVHQSETSHSPWFSGQQRITLSLYLVSSRIDQSGEKVANDLNSMSLAWLDWSLTTKA